MLQCELLCVPTSGSGFYQWVWILSVGLDFTSGSGFASESGYENPMGQTDSLLYHVIYTQPWHKMRDPLPKFSNLAEDHLENMGSAKCPPPWCPLPHYYYMFHCPHTIVLQWNCLTSINIDSKYRHESQWTL